MSDFPTTSEKAICRNLYFTGIENSVRATLAEDICDGDITAGLIPAEAQVQAAVITREDCAVCG